MKQQLLYCGNCDVEAFETRDKEFFEKLQIISGSPHLPLGLELRKRFYLLDRPGSTSSIVFWVPAFANFTDFSDICHL
jgi:hypothetical protein